MKHLKLMIEGAKHPIGSNNCVVIGYGETELIHFGFPGDSQCFYLVTVRTSSSLERSRRSDGSCWMTLTEFDDHFLKGN